jgi:hypothetical protein
MRACAYGFGGDTEVPNLAVMATLSRVDEDAVLASLRVKEKAIGVNAAIWTRTATRAA